MFQNMTRRWSSLALILGGAIVLNGCVEYTIDTTLSADGSGTREERMDAEENEDVEVTPELFLDLAYAGAEHGWSHAVELAEDGDTTHVFRRERAVPDLASWADLSNAVRLRGAQEDRAGSRVGYVSLGDVRFHNTVRVSSARVSDGSTSYLYRETFTWENGVDVVVEGLLQNLPGTLRAQYPSLPPQQIGEIVGFARARLWTAVEGGLLGGDADEDALLAEAVSRTTRQAIKIIRVYHPDAEEDDLRNVFQQLYAGDDEAFITFVEETVPGLNLAFNTEIRFRLNLPGQITSTNAQEVEGSILVWEFEPLEALGSPVEIRAESVLVR